jgi:predicted small secreted protein
MKIKIVCFFSLVLIFSCDNVKNTSEQKQDTSPLEGTWQLISGTIIEKGDTTTTDYTGNQSMIKIINKTHFAFLNHDLKKGKDSTSVFVAGGGVYTLEGDQYTEYLEYCSAREWEGNTFQFTVMLKGDTLTQQGTEKIENLDVERLNIEKYKKLKN